MLKMIQLALLAATTLLAVLFVLFLFVSQGWAVAFGVAALLCLLIIETSDIEQARSHRGRIVLRRILGAVILCGLAIAGALWPKMMQWAARGLPTKTAVLVICVGFTLGSVITSILDVVLAVRDHRRRFPS